MKVLMIDPPSGWMYGFPKRMPGYIVGNDAKFSAWLVDHDYPEKDLPLALKHSRYWEADDEA